ncbi:hypothetical protein Lfu02_01010 [Longispora fulva]|uniref:Uncharacterized protein n=1 Tax=Longispora fulva TaxID=619741 RepID=A0A8J7GCF1_9ACTN|nr:hypothetical protein [Longispora fulva]MBG6136029.1 hypothetical protein [Longispora fulva]GIG55729.1 hypothetical protein Lfu02_01010 [Longispora fulva]
MTAFTTVSTGRAREELGRFFLIAALADSAPEMFSAFIDAEWHRLLGTGAYDGFCDQLVGHPVGHREDAGYGQITWVQRYHEQFGPLPAEWFADAAGTIDHSAYDAYRSTGAVTASWNCSPASDGDGDHHTEPTK